jgi:hypothetical protein
MKTVLIGIHGLRNKPPKYMLTSWWKRSIIEGFRAIRLSVPRFKFELAYWSQYMHEKSQNPSVTDRNDPQYLWEPYVPASQVGPKEPHTFRQRLKESMHQQIMQLVAGKSGFMNIDAVSNIILHRMFFELDIYYNNDLRDATGCMRPAKELIRNELAELILKHKNKRICILAHSMGAIIAYDVLVHAVPQVPVHTLITFGAPLGFPVIIKRIKQELGMDPDDEAMLPTPESLQHKWLNFSDLDDETCLNYNLRNNYKENRKGVRPFDQLTYNTYEYDGCKNPHKVYGYLRTAEVTRAMHDFLVLENAGLWQRVKWVFHKPQI